MFGGKAASEGVNPDSELAFESLRAGDVNEDISCVSASYTAQIYR